MRRILPPRRAIRRPAAATGLAMCFLVGSASLALVQPESIERAETAHAEEGVDLAELIRRGDGGQLAAALADRPSAEFAAGVAEAIAANEARHLLDGPVLTALIERFAAVDPDLTRRFLPALAMTHNRASTRALLGELEQADDPDLARDLAAALVAQTGRDDLGEDPRRWRAWWSEHEWIPEQEWRRRLAHWHAQRAGRIAERERLAEQRLVDLYRQLHAATPAEARPPLLAAMMREPWPSIRRLGLEYASRALVNAAPLGKPVADAAAELLLSDPAPDIRADSASLLRNLNPAELDRALSEALRAESHPAVAEQLLDSLTGRQHNDRHIRTAARWLEGETPAAGAAARYLITALDQGHAQAPSVRNAIWKFVKDDLGRSAGPDGVRLYGRLAPANEITDLVELLSDGDRAWRDAAADGLIQSRIGAAALVERADIDQTLRDAAIRCLAMWLPNGDGWRRAVEILENDQHAIPDALAPMISALPPGDLLAVIAAHTDASERLALVEAGLARRAENLTSDTRDSLIAMQASALMETGEFAEAVAATATVADPTPELTRVKGQCMIIQGEFEQAEAMRLDLDTWLRAAELAAQHAPDTLDDLFERLEHAFEDRLSPSERRRVSETAARLKATVLTDPEQVAQPIPAGHRNGELQDDG